MAYPNNTARADFEFLMPNGAEGHVVQHYMKQDLSDWLSADVDDLAAKLKLWATVDDTGPDTYFAFMNSVCDKLTLANITVTGLQVVTPPQKIEAVNDSGNDTSNALPNETALVTTWTTGIVGRSYRGRNYWPGLATSVMDENGTLFAARLTAYQATFDGLLSYLDDDGTYFLAINSPTLGASTPVTGCVVRDTLHHQRRRNA